MNRIRLLSEQVANQIAAGEVVERPASVVKELVENALDAEARRVTVEIQAGGRSLIRVSDDGIGMSRDDALLCFERHATSKISRAEDLHAITSMGFRGEALPSVASVSRLSLTTRERDNTAPEGTEVVISGGKIVGVNAAGCPPGTSIEVRQLFFNLPARRKFLRSEETEYAHIHHYLTLAVLAYPNVAFTFLKDGRTVWQLPALQADPTPGPPFAALKERLRTLLGPGEELLQVDFSADLYEETEPHSADSEADDSSGSETVRLWGFIGKPGVSRATREDQHLFVNRRPVENRGLNFALLEAYHTALMKGRYPVCCLFIEISPALVDVNIHPAKKEIKFRNEKAVRRLVAQGVRQSLLTYHSSQTARPEPQPASDPVAPEQIQTSAPLPGSTKTGSPSASQPIPAKPAPVLPKIEFTKEFPQFNPLTGTALTSGPGPAPISIPPVSRTEPPPAQAAPLSPIGGAGEAVPLLKVPLRLIGSVGKLYVLFESDRGLVLMDQHAAHERILFEQMLTRLEQGDARSQRLLLPETIELAFRDAHFLRELLPTLNRLGVGLSEFGERTFLLDALPPFVKVTDGRHFILEMLDELKAAGQEVNSLRVSEHLVAKTVCRHAVKANDPLSGPELQNLIDDLRHCAMPYTCPHGRPTLIEISYRELEKKFGRLQ